MRLVILPLDDDVAEIGWQAKTRDGGMTPIRTVSVPPNEKLARAVARAAVALEDSIALYTTLAQAQEPGSESEAVYHEQILADQDALRRIRASTGLDKTDMRDNTLTEGAPRVYRLLRHIIQLWDSDPPCGSERPISRKISEARNMLIALNDGMNQGGEE